MKKKHQDETEIKFDTPETPKKKESFGWQEHRDAEEQQIVW